jgi:hypothetical protein
MLPSSIPRGLRPEKRPPRQRQDGKKANPKGKKAFARFTCLWGIVRIAFSLVFKQYEDVKWL